jgi:hypothetical protein
VTVTGLNLTTTGARLGGVARKVTGRVRADGKMEFDEFLEAVMLAHRADRLEPNLDKMRDKRPEAASSRDEGREDHPAVLRRRPTGRAPGLGS